MENLYLYHYQPAEILRNDKGVGEFEITNISAELTKPWFTKNAEKPMEMYRVYGDNVTRIPLDYRLEMPREDSADGDSYIIPTNVDCASIKCNCTCGYSGYYYLSRSKDSTPIFVEKIRAMEAGNLDYLKNSLIKQSKRYDAIMNDTERLL